MELLSDLLLNPRLWSIITPAGLVTAVLGYALYRMFVRYDKLQEQRLSEWKNMVDDYNHLAKDINNTLDLLIKLSGKNGNGGSK